jgi:hypothetical protein
LVELSKNKKRTMSKTLNQIISRLNVIANKHYFINRYGFGELSDIDVAGPEDVDYPLMWVVPQGADFDENTLTYVLRVIIMDIDDLDDSKRNEIMSDTLRTLIDVVKQFKTDDDYEWNIDETTNAIPFSQRFVDYTTGWYADIRIITDLDNNPCSIASN